MDFNIIFDLLKEVREEQKEQSKELASQSKCLIKMEASIERNTDDLKNHIKRTEQNEQMIELNIKRIEKLEEPERIKNWIKNKYLFIGSFIATLLSITALISKIKGLW